jgi:predicted dehydrogenase
MLRVGLHGTNGHQIHGALVAHPLAKLVALSDFSADNLPPALRDDAAIRHHPTLDALLADPNVDLVVLCSARRADQAADALRALRAGKHVLAEKPCALVESDLDALLATARETGRVFREMAGTAFSQPYLAMREVVRSGRLGEIVQVVAEKSYPYFDARPQDEAIDGGLIAQNAIHALRFVEHVAGTPIARIRAAETTLGNPVAATGGGLRMAASLVLTLANGGVASLAANYLNPRGTGVWGEESLKILGTQGFVESRAGGAFTPRVIGGVDHGQLDLAPPRETWLSTFFAFLLGRAEMPLTPEEELSPTRWALRAKFDATSRSA